MQAVALPSAFSAIQARAWQAFRAHVWFLLAIAAYGAALQMVVARLGAQASLSWSLYSTVFTLGVPVFLIIVVLGRIIHVMVAVRPKHLTRHLIADFRHTLFTPERFFTALPVFLALPVFASLFTSF